MSKNTWNEGARFAPNAIARHTHAVWRRAPSTTLLATALVAVGCSGGDAPAIVGLELNRTAAAQDDFVIASAAGMDGVGVVPGRPFMPMLLTASADVTVSLTSSGAGQLSFEPSSVALTSGTVTTVRVYGEKVSTAEGDTFVEARTGNTLLVRSPMTVVGGVRVGFGGVFGFVVDNNNAATATDACDGNPEPAVWRSTPLPCEGLAAQYSQLRVEEGSQAQRFSDAKRPTIQLAVTRVETFQPRIDLAQRDPLLDVGTVLHSVDGVAAYMFTDDCDGNPTTGQPDGAEAGVEVVTDVNLAVGSTLGVRYRDSEPTTMGRIWTAFPVPPNQDEIRADGVAITGLLSDDGCTSEGMTYYDVAGEFRCDAPHNVRELLERFVGYRSQIRRAWANFTTRGLVVEPGADFEASFIARLFQGGGGAEAFMQLSDYDWYTLVGRIEKGVISTGGGVPERFSEWLMADGCPTPREPELEADDDPFQ